MSSKDSISAKELEEVVKISPTPSSNSDRDGAVDAKKINIEKIMGESDDENLSGFDSDDSEDENRNLGNGKRF